MKLVNGIIVSVFGLLFASGALAQTNPGTSPLSIAKGGTSAATASGARSALGLAVGSNVEAWDADLDCIAGISAAGLIVRTGAGTCAARQVVAPAAGIAVTNPAGTGGNITLSLANDLAALEGLSSTAFAVRIATDTWAQRTMTGTSNEVCVTNGDGVSGNPTFGICSGFLSTAHSWSAAQTFAAPVFTGSADVQGLVKLSSFVTATQITANQNNYTATDGSNTCASKLTLRLSSDASRNVTGLSCSQAEGDVRIIHNVGAQSIVLTNQDTGSTAANRFLFGGDVTLAADASLSLRYDATTQRWRPLSPTSGGGGGGGGVSSVTVAAGSGISVSGTCAITTSGTCTVALNVSGLTEDTSPDLMNDFVAGYDTSGSANSKIKAYRLSGRVLLNTLTASSSASLDDTSSFSSAFSSYEIVLENIVPATSGQDLRIQVRSGGTFQTSSYLAGNLQYNGGTPTATPVNLTSGIPLTVGTNTSNSSSYGVSGTLRVYTPLGSTVKHWSGTITHMNAANTAVIFSSFGGFWNNTTALDGLRLIMSSGNITSGVMKIYGLR